MHIPQPRNDRLAGGVDDRRAGRNRHASRRPDTRNAAVRHDDGLVRSRTILSRDVDERRACDGHFVARRRQNSGSGLGHRRHAVRRRTRDELRHRVLELRPDSLEVIELRIDADERVEFAGVIGPQRLAAPQHAADAVASERPHTAAN